MHPLLMSLALGAMLVALALVLADHFREHVQGQAYAPTRETHPRAPEGFLQPPPPLVTPPENGG